MTESKAQEPSMEEILASIRRIISEEGGSQPEGEARPAAAASTVAAQPAAPAKDEVLELTDVVEDDGSVTKLGEQHTEIALETPEEPEPPPAPEPEPGEGLLSETTAAVSAGSIAELATMVARREMGRGSLPLGATDRTLEGLVVELLRPMLREWLDQNLPDLIDRLVRQEIDKLVRRAEGR